MSQYSQSEIIRILERTLPEIRKTGDPHGSLLKVAREQNLPPAVLEKTGQLYNTAKTINYLDKVDTVEKRGATFKVLDVPALLEAYEDFRSTQKKASASWMDDVFTSEEIDLSDDMNPLLEDKAPQEKAAGEAEPAAPATTPYLTERRRVARASRDLDTLTQVQRNMNLEVQKRAGVLLRAFQRMDGVPKMDVLEKEAARLTDEPRWVHEACDVLAGRMEAFGGVTRRHVKRASEDTPVDPLIDITDDHRALLDMAEYVKLAHVATAMLEEAGLEVAELKKKVENSEEGLEKSAGKDWRHGEGKGNPKSHDRRRFQKGLSGNKPKGVNPPEDGPPEEAQGGGTAVAEEEVAEEEPEIKPKPERYEGKVLDEFIKTELDRQEYDKAIALIEQKRLAEKKEQERQEAEEREQARGDRASAELDLALAQGEIDAEDQTKTEEEETARLLREQEAQFSQVAQDALISDIDVRNTLSSRDQAARQAQQAKIEAARAEAKKSRPTFTETIDKWTPSMNKVLQSLGETQTQLSQLSASGRKFYDNIFAPEHIRYQQRVDTAALYARGEAALNTLLLTDPIISEYDEEVMREVFFTLLDRNPQVATDINQLRAVLRQAGQFDGIDLDTIRSLAQLRSEDAKTRANETKGSQGQPA